MDFGELLDEAFERAGIDPASITGRHITSAKRSLDLLASELESFGPQAEYRTTTDEYLIDSGQILVALPANTIDVLSVTLRTAASGVTADLPLTRSHRQEWQSIPNKEITGTPMAFWVSKASPDIYNLITTVTGDATTLVDANTETPVLVLWPGASSDGSLIITRVRSTTAPSLLDDEVDARRNWLEIYCSGLAMKLAEKFNYERHAKLEGSYAGKLKSRLTQENEGDVRVAFRGFGFGRGRRH